MKFAITRPQGKGDALATELAKINVSALCTPVLTLNAVQASPQQLLSACDADILIFISQDAVMNFAQQIQTDGLSVSSTCQVFAVGTQTADAVKAHLSRHATVPERHDSEGLVALTALQSVQDLQVVIVKGRGGRTHIAKALKLRGARLSTCNVYERIAAQSHADDWLDLWQEAKIDGIVITSNAAVDAIFNAQQAANQAWLQTRMFVVVSERTAQHLKIQYKITNTQIVVSQGASTEALTQTIGDLNSQQGSAMTEKQQETSASIPSNEPQQVETYAKNDTAKLSKTAVLALLVALTGVGAAGGVYVYHQQQVSQQSGQIAQLTAQNGQLQSQVNATQAALNDLQKQWQAQQKTMAAQLQQQQQQVQQTLQHTLSQARQQVGGAVSSELRALARYAEFKAASERDYLGAVIVLKRLNEALSEEVATDPLKLAINQDIAMLRALPKPSTEAVYMELAGLIAQVDKLPLKTIDKPKDRAVESAELSRDISDWQANLVRSWNKIKADFLTIRQHDKPVIDPLLDAQEQQLIRAQLRSYLQQAQTAFLDNQASIFDQALSGAQVTLTSYYRTDESASNTVLEQIQMLQRTEHPAVKAPQLATPKALKEWLQ
ncbi:uroporphyrinogen-III C-methyltransferase [Pseudoalteromonas luteoviolacea]|uniref:uroporphyrinogen-III C-methyltransferase n=1 Tax=Pseudoalteromonas luteoviolacea TaxID=43657 RepID=UPI0031BAC085|nr:uroporphyrinogen-III C-methyltransferase [Pseudoalteromonas luteoviolacea]